MVAEFGLLQLADTFQVAVDIVSGFYNFAYVVEELLIVLHVLGLVALGFLYGFKLLEVQHLQIMDSILLHQDHFGD